MHVRDVLPEDRDAILSMAEAHVAETMAHLGFDRSRAQAVFDNLVGSGETTAFVAVRGEEVVGWVCGSIRGYRFTAGVFVDLEVLFVRPDMRGTRAAALLTHRFIEWSRATGAREVYMSATNPATAARTTRMFGRFGAQHVGYVSLVVP